MSCELTKIYYVARARDEKMLKTNDDGGGTTNAY